MPTRRSRLQRQLVPERGEGVLRPPLRHPLGAVRGRPRLPAGDAAGAGVGLAQRPARRLPGPANLLPAARRRLPRRGRDQRGRPRPRRRRDQGLPRQAPDPRLLLSGRHLVLPRAVGLRHHRRRPRPLLRDQPGPAAAACRSCRTCRPSRSPSGPTTRGRWRSSPACCWSRSRWGSTSSPTTSAASGPGSGRGWSSSPSRAATCARSPPGRGSAGSAASAPSGSSSRRSGSAARSAT